MLFNSYIFIFVFLPITWICWYSLNKLNNKNFVLLFLILASLVFYGYWNPKFVLILIGSIIINHFFARDISRVKFIAGIIFNLVLVGYYKYAGFILSNVNPQFDLKEIILPLGISFYTFQQIAYLSYIYKNKAEAQFLKHSLLVTFFPHCIAGPIVYYQEMIPQFAKKNKKIFENLTIGITIFIIGLFKKTVLADSLGAESTQIFSLVNNGYSPNLLEAWGAVICYTFQIYFDFSGYSDMAVGLARMFGIKFPMNFASPYKATSIIDFWRRWHITLSRFLKDFIYIPLGGNKFGKSRQLANIFITMLIGGFWHGASWMMIIWGAIHGTLLVINRVLIWIKFPETNKTLSKIIIFFVIVISWVPFRSESIEVMNNMYDGMLGINGIKFPHEFFFLLQNLFTLSYDYQGHLKFNDINVFLLTSISLLIVWGFPNTYQWMRKVAPALPTEGYEETYIKANKILIAWRPDLLNALVISLMLFFSLIKMNDVSEFIYFQF